MNPQAFTIKCNKVTNRIITECGICIAYEVANPQENPKFLKYNALWDTGATISTISPKVINELGLQPFQYAKVFHAQGEGVAKAYKVNLFLPNHVIFPCISVLEGNLHGFDVLIGMDIISQGDFVITNRDNQTVCSFQIPSTHVYDFVKQQQNQQQNKKQHKKKR